MCYTENMKQKIFNKFKDVEKGHLWNDFKMYSSVCIYDTLDEESFDYVVSNIDKIKQQALEITFDINNSSILDKAKKMDFAPDYHWYIYNISENDKKLDLDNNIKIVKKRKIVKDQLVAQMHELAQREPNMFDKNGAARDWYKSGKECIAYIEGKEIVSVLTWQYEPQNNNIHIYLTYTQPEYRSKGYNSKLFDYIKKYAFEHNIKTITVCTDVTDKNRVPNMFFKNGFKYFKTGFEKIIKQRGKL